MHFCSKDYCPSSYLFTFLVLIFISTPIFSASLDSPAAVTNATSAMFTIEDLYNRLNAGTAGTKRTTVFTEPAAGPGVTAADHDLNEVMAIAPSVDDTNGATTSEVANGKTFWGLRSGAWGQQTGTGTLATYPAVVPKTGQTSCYDSSGTFITCTGLRHDGDLQRGVAHASPRFDDPDNGTHTDQSTGLIWLAEANCAGATRSWDDALSDIVSLNTNGTMNGNNCNDLSAGGGSPTHQTDWRLPNVKELASLLDYGESSFPLLTTGHQFLNVQGGPYWTSSTRIDISTDAWVVQFSGHISSSAKTSTFYVWPVRGGQ